MRHPASRRRVRCLPARPAPCTSAWMICTSRILKAASGRAASRSSARSSCDAQVSRRDAAGGDAGVGPPPSPAPCCCCCCCCCCCWSPPLLPVCCTAWRGLRSDKDRDVDVAIGKHRAQRHRPKHKGLHLRHGRLTMHSAMQDRAAWLGVCAGCPRAAQRQRLRAAALRKAVAAAAGGGQCRGLGLVGAHVAPRPPDLVAGREAALDHAAYVVGEWSGGGTRCWGWAGWRPAAHPSGRRAARVEAMEGAAVHSRNQQLPDRALDHGLAPGAHWCPE